MIIPFFSFFIPVSLAILCPMLKITFIGLGIIVSMALSWIPLFNPLSTLIFVTKFHQRIQKIFFC